MGEPAGMVASSGEDRFELLIGKAPRFFEAVYGHTDLTVDPSIVVDELA